MNLDFTRPLLLLYAYNETDLSGSDTAQRMLDGDPLVAAEYAELNNQVTDLDAFRAEPSDEVVQRILAFAAENERG